MVAVGSDCFNINTMSMENEIKIMSAKKGVNKKSKSETGHIINVLNLDVLTTKCMTMGAEYDPANPALTIGSLTALAAESKNMMVNVGSNEMLYNNAVSTRSVELDKLKSLATQVLNSFKISKPSKYRIEKAKSINNRIQGKRVTKLNPVEPLKEDDKITKNISSAQQSINRLIFNFRKLIDAVGSEAKYIPNEKYLQVSALNLYISNLDALNTDVMTLNANLESMRIMRNKLLYAPEKGLVDVAQDVKGYVKSAFKPNSPQFKNVSKVKFVKLIVKKKKSKKS
jgi:hypothetical protein